MSTLALCMIVKNEEQSLHRCLEVISCFDEIHIVDTGSTDKTLDILSEYHQKDPERFFIHHFDWIKDFGAAREYSFSKVKSAEWVMWIDADDLLNIKDLLEAKKNLDTLHPDVNCVMLPYDYSQDEFGNSICSLKRERFIRTNQLKHFGGHARWVGAVHESYRIPTLNAVHWDKPVVRHIRHETTKESTFDRNIEILEREADLYGETDFRVMLHLGSEYKRVGRYDDAIAAYMRFAEISPFKDEKYWSVSHAAWCFLYQSKLVDAFDLCFQMITIDPQRMEAWLLGGLSLTSMNRPEEAIKWFEMGFSAQKPNTHLYVNPLEFTFIPYQSAQQCYALVGNYEKAAEYCRKALAIRPNEEALKYNLGVYEEELRLRKLEVNIVETAIEVDQQSRRVGCPSNNLGGYYHGLPNCLKTRLEGAKIKKMLHSSTYPSTIPTLVVSARVNFESWGPKNPNTVGIGGSETAIVRMLEELSDSYRCIVYNSVDHDSEGLNYKFSGKRITTVEYWRPELYDQKPVDVFIASRYTEIFNVRIPARKRIVWLQDVHCGNLTRQQDENIDHYLVLTEWHKKNFQRLYPFVDESKIFITFNAIDLEPFEEKIEKEPYRCIYASSPDRGLHYALEIWPKVLEQVPEAELHVYYGFDNIDKLIAQGRQDLAAFKEKVMYQISQMPSVHWHGRMGQEELTREWLKSSLWFHPTDFCETSCITALYAQAAGCVVLTTPLAALEEVCPFAVYVNGHAGSEHYQNTFAKKAIDILKNRELYQSNIDGGLAFVPNRTWELAASQWRKELL